MKKFIFIFSILFLPLILLSCGSVDFTASPGSSLISLLGLNQNNGVAAPGAPANLQATPIATDRIDLVWVNNSSNAEGIRIERSAGTNANFTEITSSIQGNATSYNDSTGLSPESPTITGFGRTIRPATRIIPTSPAKPPTAQHRRFRPIPAFCRQPQYPAAR